MKPDYRFVDAFEKAADLIEADTTLYNFYVPARCNVGYFSKALLGLEDDTIKVLAEDLGYYSDEAERSLTEDSCFVAKKSVPELIQLLVGAGLEKPDFEYIEYLGTHLVSTNGRVSTNAEQAINFFREEARKMREVLSATSPIPTKHKAEVPVTVSVAV